MKAIPKKVMGLGGWITVKVVPGLTHKKKKVSGCGTRVLARSLFSLASFRER
jgi:hypothetical protein